MITEIEIQNEFEKLIKCNYPFLAPIQKWNQKMWHQEGELIISLIFLSKKMKFCLFNNPDFELDKRQRWSATIYSQNLEYHYEDTIDWEKINKLIDKNVKEI
jgi:hypothetical protein